MGDGDPYFGNPKLSVLLMGVGSAAVVVTIYHCIVGWCNRHRHSPSPQHPQAFVTDIGHTPSIENSTTQLIPAHKYQKGMGLAGDDGMCAVCLSEFEEGEELRTLPECLHSYHAPCIDMWLYSHSSCPMCRTDATPSPQIFQRASELSSEVFESGMLQTVVVQSRIM